MSVRTILLRFIGDNSDYKEKAAEVDRTNAAIGAGAKSVGDKFTGWGKALMPASLAVAAIGTGILAMAKTGSDVSDVNKEFGTLSARTSTAELMIGNLRKGVLGTVSDLNLMKSANLAMGNGLTANADQMFTFAAGAKLLAGRIKGDTMEAFDGLTGAVNKGSTAALRRVGLFVDEEAALDRHAAALGKSTKALTDQERSAAIQAGVLAALTVELNNAGGATASTGDLFALAAAKGLNLVDRVSMMVANSKGLAMVVSGLVDIFGFLVDGIEAVAGWFEKVPAPIQAVVIVLGGLLAAAGPVLLVVGQLITAWGAIVPLFAAGTTGAGLLASAIALITGPVGLVVAAVVGLIAIWTQWGDDIKRIVSETYTAIKTWLWDKLEPVLTPLIGLAKSIGEMFAAFRDLMVAIGVRILASVVEWVGGTISWIRDKLQPIFAPFIAAWKLVGAVFTSVKDVVVGVVKVMYEGVKTWLLDKFTGIVDGIKGKIDAVTGFFRNMYDAVVGHSYVPDMVTGIESEFARLPQVMVAPAQAATAQVARSFFDLQGQLGGILQSLVGSLSGGGGIGGLLKGTLGQFGTGFLGGLVDSFVPGLSTVIGPLLSGLTSKIGGWIGGMFSGNDTKKDREKVATLLGFSSLEGLNTALGQMGEEGAFLLNQGLNVIGKKDKAANQEWIQSVTALFETYKSKAPEAASAVEEAAKREVAAMTATKDAIKGHFDFLTMSFEGAKRNILGVAQGIAGDIQNIFSDGFTIPFAYAQVGEGPGSVSAAANGGVVTPGGVRYFGTGGFVRRGTDTVPAMLTPGEGVLSRRGMAALSALNEGESLPGRREIRQEITVNLNGDQLLNFVAKGLPAKLRAQGRI